MVCIQVGREGGRAFFLFASALVLPYAFLPEFVGGRGCKPFLLSAASLVVCIQAGREGGRAVFFCVVPHLNFSFAYLLECV